ncbi:hypothetical protein G7046_g507 [Stylonectria norvegica]|nr:hypothetical protein G7046_g507 [Stylonectria norvegica]
MISALNEMPRRQLTRSGNRPCPRAVEALPPCHADAESDFSLFPSHPCVCDQVPMAVSEGLSGFSMGLGNATSLGRCLLHQAPMDWLSRLEPPGADAAENSLPCWATRLQTDVFFLRRFPRDPSHVAFCCVPARLIHLLAAPRRDRCSVSREWMAADRAHPLTANPRSRHARLSRPRFCFVLTIPLKQKQKQKPKKQQQKRQKPKQPIERLPKRDFAGVSDGYSPKQVKRRRSTYQDVPTHHRVELTCEESSNEDDDAISSRRSSSSFSADNWCSTVSSSTDTGQYGGKPLTPALSPDENRTQLQGPDYDNAHGYSSFYGKDTNSSTAAAVDPLDRVVQYVSAPVVSFEVPYSQGCTEHGVVGSKPYLHNSHQLPETHPGSTNSQQPLPFQPSVSQSAVSNYVGNLDPPLGAFHAAAAAFSDLGPSLGSASAFGHGQVYLPYGGEVSSLSLQQLEAQQLGLYPSPFLPQEYGERTDQSSASYTSPSSEFEAQTYQQHPVDFLASPGYQVYPSYNNGFVPRPPQDNPMGGGNHYPGGAAPITAKGIPLLEYNLAVQGQIAPNTTYTGVTSPAGFDQYTKQPDLNIPIRGKLESPPGRSSKPFEQQGTNRHVPFENKEDEDDCKVEENEQFTDAEESAAEDNDSDSTVLPPVSTTNTTKARRNLSFQEREDVKNTRKIKACVRCRVQKKKCKPSPDDPEGHCLTCAEVARQSKKTIHVLPCLRKKLTAATLYREGGLGLTRRWPGLEVKDVGARDRVNKDDIRTIEVSEGTYSQPLFFRVVKFTPRPGDVTWRNWTEYLKGRERKRRKELASYCFHDVQETGDMLERYTRENAIKAMQEHIDGKATREPGYEASHGVIERTYQMAIDHWRTLRPQPQAGVEITEEQIREAEVMESLFTLWLAIQHTTRSSYISGGDNLGMTPEMKDPSYPLLGKISVPRMIIAQFDNINVRRILNKYREKVMQGLEHLIVRSSRRPWLTIYLVNFILLREASWISQDRYRHARENYGKQIRYSIPGFVEELQDGCNNILAHWHYYNWEAWPDPESPYDRHKTHLRHLPPEQYALIMETMTDPEVARQLSVWERYKQENGALDGANGMESEYKGQQTKYDWDHPYYWISQLFETDWFAHPTYQREPVPKPPEEPKPKPKPKPKKDMT